MKIFRFLVGFLSLPAITVFFIWLCYQSEKAAWYLMLGFCIVALLVISVIIGLDFARGDKR